jgi:hypothetical protein
VPLILKKSEDATIRAITENHSASALRKMINTAQEQGRNERDSKKDCQPVKLAFD